MRKLLTEILPPQTAQPQPADRLDQPHDSAAKHVAGSAQYVDDLPEWPGTLHLATGWADACAGAITALELDAVRAAPGVRAVLIAADVPGNNDISPVFTGDQLLAPGTIEYWGQPIFAVVADSLLAARRAARLARVEVAAAPARLEVHEALAAADFVRPSHRFGRGDVVAALERAPHRLAREHYVRGQEHFYLEGQIAYARPVEDGIHVYASSQHPSEVQKLVASVLAIALNRVTVEVRRMGGGFGGKESQAAMVGCMAALAAHHTGRPVKYRMPRREDFIQTGKRHDFLNRYEVGFDSNGKILAADIHLAGKCGYSADLSDGIVDRAMFHADNAYYLPTAEVTGYRCRTNTVSNTAFRGFGGPQSMLTTEAVLDDIARIVGADPLDVRMRNLYGVAGTETPYGQQVDDGLLPRLMSELEQRADYRARRAAITTYNRQSPYLKKGLALTPVKFGISFTAKHLNQAGALVHIYTDGSVLVNHGGTEMGQGLYIKVAQIVARGLGVALKRVQVSAARTDKIANTSPTAASAGTDLNGYAALNAVNTIKAALLDFAAGHYHIPREQLALRDDCLWLGTQAVPFDELIKAAYLARVPLWASGFYATPSIGYDRVTGRGRPFFYYANGAAVSEVSVDTFTGEYRINRVDILHDVGLSLNPAIDRGQIEGGFVQGLGWLTTEELRWDARGRLISDSPANYKIPTAADVPEQFNVDFFERPNCEDTVYLSKAVGEPPLMLAISAWCALRDACASLADYRFSPPLNAPATSEQVYFCAQAARAYAESHP